MPTSYMLMSQTLSPYVVASDSNNATYQNSIVSSFEALPQVQSAQCTATGTGQFVLMVSFTDGTHHTFQVNPNAVAATPSLLQTLLQSMATLLGITL